MSAANLPKHWKLGLFVVGGFAMMLAVFAYIGAESIQKDGVVYVSRLYAPGQERRTYGLDTATGAVRTETDDGRYSPAVGAGRTLYLVGTRILRAYPAPAR